MPRRIESVMLAGPAGKLEGLLEEPEDREPVEAFVVCHPHPLHGGTMHNKVVYRIARGLRRAGGVVLRFNYRGVNRSDGQYDNGVGEAEDARAALVYLRSRYPDLPLSLAGFSFGARIVLKIGCENGAAARIVAVGVPAAQKEAADLGDCEVPRVFIQSTNDQFGPRAAMESYFERLRGSKQLIWVEATDHFFTDALDQFEEAVYRVGLAGKSGKG
jgi:alpha/beta superfamily hydrolase